MTPEDRELLKAAAKAAQLIFVVINGDGAIEKRRPGILQPYVTWNPLADDGDALRLAVKLDMCLGIAPHAVALDKTSLALAPGGDEVSIKHNGDPYAATRRAIVRAAAAIGKDMT